MKKIIVALSAVTLCIAAEAASVSWKTGTIYKASDKDGTTGSGTSYKIGKNATMMIWTVSADTYAVDSLLSTEKLYEKYSKLGSTAKYNEATTAGSTFSKADSTYANGSEEAPQTEYTIALLIDTKTAESYDGVDAFVKSYVATKSWQDTVGVTFGSMELQQTNWTAVGAVPEPTSGLLLLLGVAGLALKRRRA